MTTAAEMKERYDDPWEALADLAEENQELKEELAEHKDHTGRELADVRARISEVEEEGGSSGSNPGGNGFETPLERTAAFSQPMLDKETENTQRAIMIAKGLGSYVEYDKTQKGKMVRSSEIRKALDRLDEDTHSETVDRVMGFLEDLGKDQVEVVKKRGIKRVYFSPELVARLQSQCGDRGEDRTLSPSQPQAG